LSLFVVFAVLSVVACSKSSSTSPSLPTAAFSATDLVVGTGATAANGSRVSVGYTGWLYDPSRPENKGSQFDSGTIQPFVLGSGTLIRGFEQGIVGMRVGGSRRVVIPPDLGYGSAGRPPQIPGNATLVFDITLVSVQ